MTGVQQHRILVFGYGNPARGDDGLGPAVAEYFESLALDSVTVDADYQLTVEDAAQVAEHDITVFVDAAIDGPEPYSLSRVSPEEGGSFSSHSVTPGQVTGLAESLFDATGDIYIMGIRGYAFEMFTEQLTDQASDNLRLACTSLEDMVRTGTFPVADDTK